MSQGTAPPSRTSESHGEYTSHQQVRRALALALIPVVTLAACGGDRDDDASPTAATDAPARPGDRAIETSGEAPAATMPPADAPAQDASLDFGSIGRDVIVELRVQMESDDIARTVASITAATVNVGGGVASSDVSYGTRNADGEPNRDGHAVLVLKVPPAEVGNVIAHLDGTGRVLAMNQTAQDVTEQLVDLDVRIANKRESVESVREMMGSTTDLAQLVTLEAELTWRRTELEQLEAQQRNLADRVARSTITVEIRPDAAPGADDGSIGDAFGQGWNAFRDVVFATVIVLATLAPFLVTALVIAALVRIVTRPRKQPSQPAPAPDDELTNA